MKLTTLRSPRGTAIFSEDMNKRYTLSRYIEPKPHINLDDQPYKWRVYIMLNPSTADHETDDATIRRCISFAKRDGFQAMGVVNLFSIVSTDPGNLPVTDMVDLPNAQTITTAIPQADQIVVAWGNYISDWHRAMADECIEYIRLMGKTPYCFGVNRNGSPRHPVRLANNVEVRPYE